MADENAGSEPIAPPIQSTPVEPPPKSPQQELDEWANQEPKARRPDGTFAKQRAGARADAKEVRDALKATVRQGARQDPSLPQENAPEGEPEALEATPKRRVKGTVNGREEEFDIDSQEFQKLNAVQAMRAAQEAFREASEMRKEAQLVRQALEVAKGEVSKNPFALLQQLGISRDQLLQFAQQQVYEKIAETVDPNTGQPYTPEQQRILQLQNELKAKQQQEELAKQKQEQVQLEQLKEVMRKDLDRTFTEALQQTGLPPTQYTMMRLADLMESMGPDVDAKMLAPIVFEDLTRELAETIGAMPVDIAIQLLPKQFVDSLRKYDLDAARSSKQKLRGNSRSIPGNRDQRIPDRNEKVTNMKDAQDWLDKWAEGR